MDFDLVIKEYRKRFFRHAMLLTKDNKMDAEDLLQDTMIAVLAKRKQFDNKSVDEIAAYIYRSLCNKFIDTTRHSKRRRLIVPAADDLIKLHHNNIITYNTAFSGEPFQIALEKLDRMPEPIKFAMVGQLLGYKAKEIAILQGTGINTALGRIRYAKQYLRGEKKVEAGV